MIIIFSLLFSLSFCLLALFLLENISLKSKKKDERASNDSRIDSVMYRVLLPASNWASPLISKMKIKKYHKLIRKKIGLAGLDEVLSEIDIVSYQFVLFCLFLMVGLILGFGLSSIFLGLFGFVYPIIWLKQCRQKIKQEIEEFFPNTLDSLSLSVQAGSDFVSAIQQEVSEGENNLLKQQLKNMLSEIRLGKMRVDALNGLKDRLMHPYIDSFVSTLVQADKFGVSISQVLQMYAKKMRSERYQIVEKKGVLASQTILLPLVFCIMPAVFIVVFAPIVIMWIDGTLFKFF